MKKLRSIKESGIRVVLASKSPRRQELLKNLALEFDVITSKVDEKGIVFDWKKPAEYAQGLAYAKALAVAEHLDHSVEALVIGADTIVVMDGRIMGQPDDEADARRMLEALSGTSNEVITGVSVIRIEGGVLAAQSGHESTDVYFRALSSNDIDKYIETGEPMDKAGAYGIQGFASLFVERINGCYFNVVGLPIMRLSKLLEAHGYSVL